MSTKDVNALTPEAVVEQLRAVRESIPEYSQLTVTAKPSLRGPANADLQFVNAAINAIGASPTVQNAVNRTPDGMRQEVLEVSRWTAVEDELKAMLKGVSSSNLIRRHRLGLSALQAYSISRQLVRQPEHANLLPHLDEMRRTNKFGRKRKPAPPADAEPLPIPSPKP